MNKIKVAITATAIVFSLSALAKPTCEIYGNIAYSTMQVLEGDYLSKKELIDYAVQDGDFKIYLMTKAAFYEYEENNTSPDDFKKDIIKACKNEKLR